jgi:adenine phosphoribosyltransferase
MDIKQLIRTIPDHPKPGIQFRDITTLLLDPDGVRSAVEQLAAPFGGGQIQKVAGVEARGFIFGLAVAMQLDVGFAQGGSRISGRGPIHPVRFAPHPA